MKKISIAAKLAAVILCLALISGIVSSAVAAAEDSVIGKCSHAFYAAEPICADLLEFVNEEISSFDDDEAEYDEQEARAVLIKLQDCVKRLDTLMSGIPAGGMDTGEARTVKATRDYLTMLKNMSSDMNELVEYSLDFTAAVMPMTELGDSYEDYETLAGDIYTNTTASLELLNQITPPSYLAITHGDLIVRIKEFQDFAVDFYAAAGMGDPLRVYSCVYRMDRIEVMFTKCGGNLDADIKLQLKQAERRFNGFISILREELSAVFAPLKSKERGA
jgi:hypothetical protein